MVVGFGVDARGFGVGFALHLLDLFVGGGLHFAQVAIFFTEDARGLAFAFAAEALGDLLALADHAFVDAVEDLCVVVHALDAHVEQLDTERRELWCGCCEDVLFNFQSPAFDDGQRSRCDSAFFLRVLSQFAAFVAADDFDQLMAGHCCTNFTADDVFEP